MDQAKKKRLKLWVSSFFLIGLGGFLLTPVLAQPAPLPLDSLSDRCEWLWEETQKSLAQDASSEAASSLEQLVQTCPGKRFFASAHLLLGKIHLKAQRFEEALPLLRWLNSQTVFSLLSSSEQAESLLSLGQCYLGLHHYPEAYFIAHAGIKREFHLPILLVEAQAHFGMSHFFQAQCLADFLEKTLQKEGEYTFLKEAVWTLQLQLKLQRCKAMPSSLWTLEAQLEHQLQRKGLCLMEALSFLYKGGMEGFAMREAQNAWLEELKTYRTQLINPPKLSPQHSDWKALILSDGKKALDLGTQILESVERQRGEQTFTKEPFFLKQAKDLLKL